jgi:hypothetical protein
MVQVGYTNMWIVGLIGTQFFLIGAAYGQSRITAPACCQRPHYEVPSTPNRMAMACCGPELGAL